MFSVGRRVHFWRDAVADTGRAFALLAFFVGGSAVAYVKFAHHRPLVVLLGSVCTIALFMESAYRRYELMRADRDGLLTEPVTPSHEQQLKSFLTTLQHAVQAGQNFAYNDHPQGAGNNRRAFRAHFGQLGRQVDDWNAAVERLHVAPLALRQALWEQAAALRIDGPAYSTRRGIVQMAIQPCLDAAPVDAAGLPLGFGWTVRSDPTLEGAATTVSLGNSTRTRVALLQDQPGESDESLAERANAVIDAVTALFKHAQTCDVGVELHAAQAALEALKMTVPEELGSYAHVSIRMTEECPSCWAQLHQLDPVVTAHGIEAPA